MARLHRGEAPRHSRQLIIVAAGAVMLLCLVGIGVITGWIPNPAAPAPAASTSSEAVNFSPLSPGAASAPIGNVDEAALPESAKAPPSIAPQLPSTSKRESNKATTNPAAPSRSPVPAK